MSFKDRLKQARKKSNLTQKELAQLSGLATGTIQQYELGKRVPVPEALAKIAAALNLGYSYTKTGEPYFYGFVDTVPNPEYADNEMFNKSQYSDASETDTDKDTLNSNYDKVNEDGKKKIVEYSSDIAGNPIYRKGDR